MDANDDFDSIRYKDHLQHGGDTNRRILWATWATIAFVLFMFALCTWSKRWKQTWPHQHQYRLLESDERGSQNSSRILALLGSIMNKPLSHVIQRIVPAPTFGGFVLLISYLAVTILLTTTLDAPSFYQLYAEGLAFRAAWITLTQIPLVYLLSSKRGPLNLVTGISYERINYIHRWIGRTLFLTATLHVGVMKSLIPASDILFSHEQGMGIVRHGVGAYVTLLWIVVTSVLPVRKLSHRVFHINHWISTIGFLMITAQHVPSYARAPIFIAGGILVLDKCLVLYHAVRNNVSFQPLRRKLGRFGRKPERGMLVTGYAIDMTAPSSSILGLPTQTKETATVIRIAKLPFTWRPGQHIRLYVPALGVFESHPFTPANCSALPPPPLPPRKDIEHGDHVGPPPTNEPAQTSEMLLMIRAKSGLTQHLANYHAEWLTRPCPNASETPSPLIAYLDGPYGQAPLWENYGNLVLVSTSTGVSFMIAILDHLEQLCFTGTTRPAIQCIRFIWVIRHTDPHFEDTVLKLLRRYAAILCETGIAMSLDLYITCPESALASEPSQYDQFAHLRRRRRGSSSVSARKLPLRIRHPEEIYDEWDREADMHAAALRRIDPFDAGIEENERWSFESDGSSENGTLVDGGEGGFARAYAMEGPDDAFRPLPRPGALQQFQSAQEKKEDGCQCAMIQHQRRKLSTKGASGDFVTQWYGVRPDLSAIMAEAVPPNSTERTMVAVCAHEDISREIQNTVSDMNMEFARWRRQVPLSIHVEGFQ
ncbi:hypothetical protein IAQ61_001620 [Plenodomus lingam]|uniref:FAD-binding FR-type domain-containing protein n=1 Tax=Leptosphaeria maculans (strain JN3 / isolate v23.1.3 / race Av1-4-5-6-7-8) TaxID=985895 RepID=E4ZFU1_LEPMJ|nr:hypothetical protein LEMA_P062870.1 [Plenodomus lingam JN3]KAH9878349.1 hypothetical protein IAQ61_001620 [Plenodomus lingam]CBX90161.1 hypothetical protein LEMA_P062870.1 [Plenodomus lingam JN3]